MFKMKQKLIVILSVFFIWTIQSQANVCETTEIVLGESIKGSWDDTCVSTNREGKYAKFYSFTLEEEQSIVIDLTSATDTYLLLLDSNQSGGIFTIDNNGGEGSNSQLLLRLGVGTYVLEATTYEASQIDDFNLSLQIVHKAIILQYLILIILVLHIYFPLVQMIFLV